MPGAIALGGGLSVSANQVKGVSDVVSDVVEDHTILVIQFLVAVPCALSKAISALNIFTERPSRAATQGYVLFWLVVLGVYTGVMAAFVPFPKSGLVRVLVLVIPFYRLQDLFFSTLDDALGITGRFESVRDDMTHKVLITLVNIVQIVLIFTIAFSVLTTKKDWAKPPVPFGTGSCFILSWSSLTPFTVNQNAADPKTWALTIIESAIAVVILLVVLGRFLALSEKPLPPPLPPIPWPRKKGRPVSWVAVSTMVAGFLIGGIGLISGPKWSLFWVGVGMCVAGGLLALAIRIFDDWY
jgi:hypothetical protein